MLRTWLLVIGTLVAIKGGPALGQNPGDNDGPIKSASASAAGEPGSEKSYYCRVQQMPISWGTRGQPVEIVHSDAVFTELGTTWPALDVKNTQASPITNLALVMEYLDGQQHKATTAAIAVAAAGYEKQAPVPFSVESISTWKEPLDPGKIARVSGTYDSVRTITCPEAARITFAMVRYRNGTVQRYAAEGWSVPPLPKFVPEIIGPCPAVQTNPTQVRAKVHLSASGNVIGISGPLATKDNPDQVAWIATQLEKWTFQPLLIDGHPREDDLEVEFVLYGEPEPNLAAITLASPATLIVFYPRKDASPGCVESFGFLHEVSTVP